MSEAATVRVADGAAPAEVFAIRKEVFVVEQGVPEDAEWDDHDGEAVHLLAAGPDGAALGTVRMLTGDVAYAKNGGRRDTAVLGRLAVRRAARGTGLGAVLVRALEDEARRRGLTGVYLEAQVAAIPFYERLCYLASGPEFDDGSGIMHRSMRREL